MAPAESRATRFYRSLLKLLPFDFRSDFGPEMETVFNEQRKEAERREGTTGVLRLWWETIAGIFRTAPAEHLAMFRQDARFALRMMRKNLGWCLHWRRWWLVTCLQGGRRVSTRWLLCARNSAPRTRRRSLGLKTPLCREAQMPPSLLAASGSVW